MNKIERCNYGRINYEKRRLLLGALLMVAIGVAVFVLGLLLNKFEKRNIFTVAAVCMVLPMTRYLVTFFALLPYHTAEKSLYNLVKEHMPEQAVLVSDYVFTLSEKVMGLSFLVLTDHEYYGLIAREQADAEKLRSILADGLKKCGFSGKVVVCTNAEQLLTKLSKAPAVTKTEEEWKELLDFLRALAI